tara:strand:- start:12374 stop:13225 length:852 start_codon:yes stop_codon:yes gene_type:complete
MKAWSNIPEKAHFYWEGDGFTYLHYLSVKSFVDQNPSWECIVHTNKVAVDTFTTPWTTPEQKKVYTGRDYFYKLKELGVTFNEVDFEAIGVEPDINPVFKSDILRWYLLGTQGGAWIDADILHLKPLSSLRSELDEDITGCYVESSYPTPHFIIGFFLSKPDNPYFLQLYQGCKLATHLDYQMFGNKLLASYKERGLQHHLFKNQKMQNLHPNSFYIHPWFEIDQIFNAKSEKYKSEQVVGVHWFNGDSRSTDFCNQFDEGYDLSNPETTIEEILYECKRTNS